MEICAVEPFRLSVFFRSVEKNPNIRVYICAYQSSLPVSLQTRNERIGKMCVTVLVVGFNGQRGDKERKKPHVLLEIFAILTENCTRSRKCALWWGKLNGGKQRGESRELWKEGKGLSGYHLWKKPIILTIHMCSDESPAKETKWMNAPTAARRLCSVFTAGSYTRMFMLSDPASLVPSVFVRVLKRVLSLDVFEKWHKWDFASTPCGRSEPGGVTPAAFL